MQDGNQDVDIAKSTMYSRFSITGKEISAFVVDRDFHWSEIASLSSASQLSGGVSPDTDTDVENSRYNGILPVLDPCGMSLVLDQVLYKCLWYLGLPSNTLAYLRLPVCNAKAVALQ